MSVSDELRRIFNSLDVDGDGKISSSEVGAMIRSLGQKATEDEIKMMIAEADKDGDGFISLDEFMELNLKKSDDAELRGAFSVFDKDGNGSISVEELHKVLRGLGQNCSVDDCRRMIRGVDVDGDGSVDFEEFKVMMDNNGMRPSHTDSKNDTVL